MALADVVAVVWKPRDHRLDLVTAEQTLALEGSSAPMLAAALAARGVRFAPDAAAAESTASGAGGGFVPAAPTPLLKLGTATWLGSPLDHVGVLAMGGAGLRFEPTGLVEQLAGVRGFTVSPDALQAGHIDQGRLHLTTGGGTQRLRVEGPGEWVAALAALVSGRPIAPEVATPEPPGADQTPPQLSFDATLEERDRPGFARGRAHLAESGELFFCGLDGSVKRADIAALQRAVYGRPSEEDPDGLALLGPDAARWRLQPCGGAADIERLRALALELPIADAVELASLGPLRRLTGDVSHVRVTTNHRDALTMRPGALVQAPAALGVVLSGDGAFRPAAGTRIRVVIGQDRGTVEVDGRVGHSDEDGAEWGHPGRPILFVTVPHIDNVRVVKTRRDAYRVPASERVTVRPLEHTATDGPTPSGPAQSGRLVDLSAGGCGVMLRQPEAVGSLIQIKLPVQGRAELMSAQVVFHTRTVEDELEMWHHGVRFEGLTEADHERLSREVQRRETQAMREQADAAEAAKQAALEAARAAALEAERAAALEAERLAALEAERAAALEAETAAALEAAKQEATPDESSEPPAGR